MTQSQFISKKAGSCIVWVQTCKEAFILRIYQSRLWVQGRQPLHLLSVLHIPAPGSVQPFLISTPEFPASSSFPTHTWAILQGPTQVLSLPGNTCLHCPDSRRHLPLPDHPQLVPPMAAGVCSLLPCSVSPVWASPLNNFCRHLRAGIRASMFPSSFLLDLSKPFLFFKAQLRYQLL